MQRFPASILGSDEDLVFDLRPHWIALVRPAAQTLALVVALVVVWLVVPYSWGAWIYVIAALIAVVAFLLAPGQAFTRDQLLEHVWGYDYAGETRTVDVHVHWLRSTLEDDAAAPRFIHTIRGVGYVFRRPA